MTTETLPAVRRGWCRMRHPNAVHTRDAVYQPGRTYWFELVTDPAYPYRVYHAGPGGAWDRFDRAFGVYFAVIEDSLAGVLGKGESQSSHDRCDKRAYRAHLGTGHLPTDEFHDFEPEAYRP